MTLTSELTIPSPESPPGTGRTDADFLARMEMGAVPAETKDILPVEDVPEILDPARQDEYLDAYLQEHQPVGPTEHAIVRELARHAAALDLWSAAGDAVQRQGARELPDLTLRAGHDDSLFSDAVLAGTMSQEIVHRCERHDPVSLAGILPCTRQTGGTAGSPQETRIRGHGYPAESLHHRSRVRGLSGGQVQVRQMPLPALRRRGGTPHRESPLLGVCEVRIANRCAAWNPHG